MFFNLCLGINSQTKSENIHHHPKHNDNESTRSPEQPSLNQIVESTSTTQPSQKIAPPQPQLIPVQENSCQQEGKYISTFCLNHYVVRHI